MYGLSENTIEKIKSVFSKYSQIEKALIYGSRAKGSFKNGSDVDIVFFGEDLTHDIIFNIEEDIDDLYFPYSFDLSIYDEIDNLKLKEHIDRAGLLFFHREN
jgi:predicted nucleotidyltransferase